MSGQAIPNAKDLQETAQHLMEDAAGAEFVAAVDAAESLGTHFDFVESVFELVNDQARYAREDYAQMAKDLKAGAVPIHAVGQHIQRRVTHHAEGWRSYYQAVMDEQARLRDLHLSVWRPLIGLINKDLNSVRS